MSIMHCCTYVCRVLMLSFYLLYFNSCALDHDRMGITREKNLAKSIVEEKEARRCNVHDFGTTIAEGRLATMHHRARAQICLSRVTGATSMTGKSGNVQDDPCDLWNRSMVEES